MGTVVQHPRAQLWLGHDFKPLNVELHFNSDRPELMSIIAFIPGIVPRYDFSRDLLLSEFTGDEPPPTSAEDDVKIAVPFASKSVLFELRTESGSETVLVSREDVRQFVAATETELGALEHLVLQSSQSEIG